MESSSQPQLQWVALLVDLPAATVAALCSCICWFTVGTIIPCPAHMSAQQQIVYQQAQQFYQQLQQHQQQQLQQFWAECMAEIEATTDFKNHPVTYLWQEPQEQQGQGSDEQQSLDESG